MLLIRSDVRVGGAVGGLVGGNYDTWSQFYASRMPAVAVNGVIFVSNLRQLALIHVKLASSYQLTGDIDATLSIGPLIADWGQVLFRGCIAVGFFIKDVLIHSVTSAARRWSGFEARRVLCDWRGRFVLLQSAFVQSRSSSFCPGAGVTVLSELD